MTMPGDTAATYATFNPAREVLGDTPVSKELDRLGTALNDLDGHLSVLLARLAPVVPEGDERPMPGRVRSMEQGKPSPLRDRIRHAADEVERIADAIQAAVEALEI